MANFSLHKEKICMYGLFVVLAYHVAYRQGEVWYLALPKKSATCCRCKILTRPRLTTRVQTCCLGRASFKLHPTECRCPSTESAGASNDAASSCTLVRSVHQTLCAALRFSLKTHRRQLRAATSLRCRLQYSLSPVQSKHKQVANSPEPC
jgi:hypothetical protein